MWKFRTYYYGMINDYPVAFLTMKKMGQNMQALHPSTINQAPFGDDTFEIYGVGIRFMGDRRGGTTLLLLLIELSILIVNTLKFAIVDATNYFYYEPYKNESSSQNKQKEGVSQYQIFHMPL